MLKKYHLFPKIAKHLDLLSFSWEENPWKQLHFRLESLFPGICNVYQIFVTAQEHGTDRADKPREGLQEEEEEEGEGGEATGRQGRKVAIK